MMLNALRSRELGSQLRIGDTDRMYRRVYSKFQVHHKWEQQVNSGSIYNLEFSPDGSCLVAVCEKSCFLVLDAHSGRLLKQQSKAHTDCVNNVTFLDSRTFATCSDDMTVALWDLRYLKGRLRQLNGHTRWVKNLQYINSSGKLMSSGFDGNIYMWDVNRYTEDTGEMRELAYNVNGLMRSCVSPDETKMVISTDSGYLMVIHDLDFQHLSSDLGAFNSRVYNSLIHETSPIMQRRRTSSLVNHKIFTQPCNRLEIIHDFPSVNTDCSMITGLTVHPYSWCVLSRNTSSMEDGEWTCIHDIQPLPDVATIHHAAEKPTHIQSSKGKVSNKIWPQSCHKVNSILPAPSVTARQPPGNNVLPPDTTADDTDTDTDSNSDDDDEDSVHGVNQDSDNASNASYESVDLQSVYRMFNSEAELAPDPHQEHSIQNIDGYSHLMNAMIHCTPPLPHFVLHPPSRLSHYISEPNVGRGFIKESCFSPDGRIICSPFAHSIRILAFNRDVSELSDCVPDKYENLYELRSNMSHTMPVLCTKYSPNHPIIASGSMDGNIHFHQPVL